VLISVMSDRNASLESGVATIEDVASITGDVVRARREQAETHSLGVCYVSVPPISAC
jgi:hypothetical protein